MTVRSFDVLTMGRVSVDLYPEQSGVPLADVRTGGVLSYYPARSGAQGRVLAEMLR